ncbi:MAG: 3-deoxy-manno-octulosonate cytidylyltransferase [Clostridiales bacterium]|jgi:3-deoxy-manno-octulosonate cytidylyltransferase (CMP-KDO synthetase)|nr:3-deoxy-manno-octulosonate cytidylyltransferase [Clostridiales bacterium]
MKTIGVIPARYASSRFPGKPLADINGKPMIWWVWNTAKQVRELNELYIATDDWRIAEAVSAFGGKVIITGDCDTGTDRVAEAALKTDGEIYVNIQGDEPLIECKTISQALATVAKNEDYFGTLAVEITNQNDIISPHNVKIVFDHQGYAMYFSRTPIPSNLKGYAGKTYKHLGIYVYRRDFLLNFTNMPHPEIELSESIEPLRAMYYGYKLKVELTQNDSIGVDTYEDLVRVRNLLSTNKINNL